MKRKRLLSTAGTFVCALCITFGMHAQNYQWIETASGPSNFCLGMDVDIAGNSYCVGSFRDSADFGTGWVFSQGSYDIYVMKRDPLGTAIWTKTFGGTQDDRGYALSVSSQGIIGIIGTFTSASVNFGSDTAVLSNSMSGGQNVFILALDVSGNSLWARQSTGWCLQYADDIAFDPSGNVVIVGSYQDSVVFGTTSLVSGGSNDVFVSCYDPSGNCLWADGGGTPSFDFGLGIACDVSGNIYVVGEANQGIAQTVILSFGSVSAVTTNGKDAYLLKIDPLGNPAWVKTFGGSGVYAGSGAFDVDVSSSGIIAFTGTFTDTVALGSFSVSTAAVNGDGFVAATDANGTILWAQNLGASSTGAGIGQKIRFQGNGNITVAGLYQDTLQTSDYFFPGFGSFDMFVMTFNQFGYVSGKTAGGILDDGIFALAIDGLGNTYAAGVLSSAPTVFDTASINCVGLENSFVLKLGPSPTTTETFADAQATVSVFPNPFDDVFAVVVPEHSFCDVTVSDMTGREVFRTCISGSSTIARGSLASGMYLVRVVGENIDFSEKLIAR